MTWPLDRTPSGRSLHLRCTGMEIIVLGFRVAAACCCATHSTVILLETCRMLSASSFQFRIPTRRIRDGGRIWPQFRLHTFIFTTRSVLFMALYWYEQQNGLEPQYHWNWVLVMLGMAAADFVTNSVGDVKQPNTIRDAQAHGGVKFAFSIMQFNATTAVAFGVRALSLPFLIMYVVQLTPFVGTLRRKGLFKSNFWGGFMYAAFLGCGFANQAYQYTKAGGEKLHLVARCVALLAAILRLSPLIPSFC